MGKGSLLQIRYILLIVVLTIGVVGFASDADYDGDDYVDPIDPYVPSSKPPVNGENYIDSLAHNENEEAKSSDIDEPETRVNGTSSPGVNNLAGKNSYQGSSNPPGTINNQVETSNSQGFQAGVQRVTPVESNARSNSPAKVDSSANSAENQWKTTNGNWAVVTGRTQTLKQSSASTNCYAYVGSITWTNYSVQARIKALWFIGFDRPFGLMARFRDINNFYYLRISNANKLEIRKKINGSITLLAAKAYPVQSNTWYNVKLAVNGSKLDCSVNDKLELTATDTNLNSGQIGVMMNCVSVEIENVILAPLGAINPIQIKLTPPIMEK